MSEFNEKSLMLNQTSASIKFDSSRIVESSKCFDKAVCVKGNACMFLCVTQGCQKPGIVCSDISCECNLVHSEPNACRLSNPRTILKKLERKRIEILGINGHMNEAFLDLTDWISEFEKELESKIYNMGLSDQQRGFLELTQKGQLKELTGQKMSVVFKQLNRQEKLIEKLKEKMKESWEYVVDSVKEQIEQLEKVINEFGCQVLNRYQKECFIGSEIATTKDERDTLLSFFPEAKKPIGSKLLFRASQHNFSAAKFNEICFQKENTVTIVKTNLNKVIGGFTPLAWLGRLSLGVYEEDKSHQSFTFSLTNQEKFEIKNGDITQVYYCKDNGPTFRAGHDICIADSANTNTNSYANADHSYQNPKNITNRKNFGDSGLFSGGHGIFSTQGGQSSIFSTQEWQVFQLIFKQ